MRIAVVNTVGSGLGGAFRAARRLILGLRQRGHEVVLLSLDCARADDGIGIRPTDASGADNPGGGDLSTLLRDGYIQARRSDLSNTLYAPPIAGFDLASHKLLGQFDLINIHWVAGLLSTSGITGLLRSRRPVVFTLHDMATLTGGCHYSAGCDAYRGDCTPCPQLRDDELGIAARIRQLKRQHWHGHGAAAIAPSRWLADCASTSGLFAPERVYTVPNGLETELFRPTTKRIAKAALGIPAEVRTLVFGAENNSERRKGFDLLLETLEQLKSCPGIARLIGTGHLRVLVFGTATPELRARGIPLQQLGAVEDDEHLALIYSAADAVLLPSREDNLPNIMLEAMACGTPVAAFGVGGILDIIEDGRNGRIVALGDTSGLANAVAELLLDADHADALGRAARTTIEDHCRLELQASRYEQIFESLRPTARTPDPVPSEFGGETTIDVPYGLDPELEGTPVALFLEQQRLVQGLRTELIEAGQRNAETHQTLRLAVDDILDSSSWRLSAPLRRNRNARDVWRVHADTPLPRAATALLELTRSKSWELTAPARIGARLLNAARSRLRPEPRPAAHGHDTRSDVFAVRSIELPNDVTGAASKMPRRPLAFARRRSSRPHVLCLHLYHTALWPEFEAVLRPIVGPERPLFLSVPEQNAEFAEALSTTFPRGHCSYIEVDNRGMDVYPFLLQYQWLIDHDIEPATMTKLHTKRSVHHESAYAAEWRTALYRKLCMHHPLITEAFRDGRLGMVASGDWWVREPVDHPHFLIERNAINQACWLLGIEPTYEYLTGSMYVVSFAYLRRLLGSLRPDALADLFPSGYRPCGTLAHGLERAVCYGLRTHGFDLALV